MTAFKKKKMKRTKGATPNQVELAVKEEIKIKDQEMISTPNLKVNYSSSIRFRVFE